MALTEPLDVLVDFPGWSNTYELAWRQEQSRHASGRTRVKDFGTPLWRATYQSRLMKRRDLDVWRAKLDALENGLVTFKAYAMSRCRPMAHQGTGTLPVGALHTIGDEDKSIRVSGLPGITLSIGDMIRIGTQDVHRVMEARTAVSGLTGLFEIRPHLWPGVTTGASVSIERPYCLMTVVPNSLTTASGDNGWGTVSFQAIEARP